MKILRKKLIMVAQEISKESNPGMELIEMY